MDPLSVGELCTLFVSDTSSVLNKGSLSSLTLADVRCGWPSSKIMSHKTKTRQVVMS
jgi:hypothetical protein